MEKRPPPAYATATDERIVNAGAVIVTAAFDWQGAIVPASLFPLRMAPQQSGRAGCCRSGSGNQQLRLSSSKMLGQRLAKALASGIITSRIEGSAAGVVRKRKMCSHSMRFA